MAEDWGVDLEDELALARAEQARTEQTTTPDPAAAVTPQTALNRIAQGSDADADFDVVQAAIDELARVRPVVDAAREVEGALDRGFPDTDFSGTNLGKAIAAQHAALAALDGDAAATPQPAAGRELLAFVEDTERRLPLLRETDPHSDWSRGVAWALDRARASVRALATPTTERPSDA